MTGPDTAEARTGSLVGPDALAMVGREISQLSGPVVAREFQRFAAAVGDRNPLYFDADYARAQGYRDIIAPPLFLQVAVLGVIDLEALRPDGVPDKASLLVPLPDAPRLMAGGDSYEFHAPAYPGDEVTATRRIESVVEKQGRSGPFVVVTARTTYTNQHGTVLVEATDVVIARPLPQVDREQEGR